MIFFWCICILKKIMYVKHHEQFEIGCGAILTKIYYYYIIKYSVVKHSLYEFPICNKMCIIWEA